MDWKGKQEADCKEALNMIVEFGPYVEGIEELLKDC